MKRVGWLGLVGLCLIAAGCKSTPPPAKVYLTGDPVVDAPEAIKYGPSRDKVLWQYRLALALMRRGQFADARQALEPAIDRIGNIYGPDKDAKQARGYFQTESKKGFIGEPYERVMAYYYRGILYWMNGEPDNARACFRNGQLIDSDTENKTYAADYVLLDYLDGYVTAKLGDDGSDALKRATNNAKMWRPPAFNTQANVFFFVEYGPGPTKFATGEYHEQLRFQCHEPPVRGANVKVDGRTLMAPPYDDLCFQATTRGGRVMDHILANKVVFKNTTDAVGNVALIGGAVMATQHDTQAAGLGLMAVGLISKIVSASTTPQADTRTWESLPLYLSFASAELPPGPHTATVEFLNGANQTMPALTKTVTFTVAAGPGMPGSAKSGDTVIFVSDQSTTPQSL